MRKMSIKSRIFLPVLLLLLLFPLAAYLVFDVTAKAYVQGLAEADLKKMLQTVQPLADQIFQAPAGTDAVTRREQRREEIAQAKEFLDQMKTLLRKEKNDTYLIILNAKFEPVYPKEFDSQPGTESLYAHYAAQLADGGQIVSEKHTERLTLDDRQYIAYFQQMDNARARANYLIAYTPVNNTDSLLSDVAKLVLLITAFLAALSLLAMWLVAGSISRPIRRLCNHAAQIGAGDFRLSEEKSSLKEIDALNLAMNQMSQQLSNYDTAQKTFFQNASHELRTPLMSIRGYAEGIQCGVFSNHQEAAGVIVSESARLTELVDGLLTLSRLDSAKQTLDLQPVQLSDFLSGYLKKIEGLAIGRGITLSLEERPAICAQADGELLGKVFLNLVSNCIRYAKTTVGVDVKKEGRFAVITVEDDGPGFAPEDAAHLFERFYKGKDGNFGLGLAIAKSSAEYMGGSIRAFNGSCGAVFELKLLLCGSDNRERFGRP